MNTISLVGNLVLDPVLKQTKKGAAYCFNVLAVHKPVYSKNEQRKQKDTNFIKVTFWRKQAELVSKYLQKGSKIAITGILETESIHTNGKYEDKYYISVNHVTFCNNRKKAEAETEQKNDDESFFNVQQPLYQPGIDTRYDFMN